MDEAGLGKCIPASPARHESGPRSLSDGLQLHVKHRQPEFHLVLAYSTSQFSTVIPFKPIMPADRLLGTLLRSLQVYTDQQDTPR